MNINRNVYVLLAVLLLFATLSSFVINVKGDTNIATNEVQKINSPLIDIEGDVLYVYPYDVPRYCDVFVKTYPNTEVNVYRINGQDTGIQCTTNNEGECTFNFGLKESKGLYYVQAKNLTHNVYLDPTTGCDLTYKADRLEMLPENITLEAGNNHTFDVNSYLGENLIESKKDYLLSNNFSATIVDSNNTNVQVFVTGAGEVELTAYSGHQVASSQITIVPNACVEIYNINVNSVFVAGSNIVVSYLVTDAFGNVNSNVVLSSEIILPDEETIEMNLTANDEGIYALSYPVNVSGNYTVITQTNNEEICGNQEIEFEVQVIPNTDSLNVELIDSNDEVIGDNVTMYVDDEFTFNFVVYDDYSNQLDENSYFCEINSSNENIFEYLFGSSWNEFIILSGPVTGEANMTYECRLSPTAEPFKTGLVEIRTTGNLNNPGEIFVVSSPDTLMAGNNETIELALLDSYGYLIEEEVVYTYDVLYGEVINNTYYAPTYLNGESLLVDEVNVSYDNVTTTFNVEIIPNVPHTLELTSSIIEIEQNQPFNLSVVVKDEFNNLIPNIEVNFSIESGPATLNVESATTNVNGEALVHGFSGDVNGTVVYSSFYNELIVYGEFEVLEQQEPPKIPTNIVCMVSPYKVFLNEETTITCTVYDEENEVLENTLVEFNATGGLLSMDNATTSETGRVTVNFQSDVEGVYNITSTVGTVSSVVSVIVEVPDTPGIYSGNIIDQALNPVENTVVKVLLNGALIETIDVDVFGNFNTELQPGIYDVIIEAPGYLTIYDYGLVINSGESEVKNYVLTTLSRLSGNVTNETSHLMSGATVEIYRNNKLVESILTEADGEYSFTVASGVYTVKVMKDEYMTSYFSIYLAPSTEVEKAVVIYR
jgi:hypothetical protein